MTLPCCLDRAHGAGCTAATCMALPDGATCGDCAHLPRCKMLFGATPEARTCDFFPRRFLPEVA